LASIVSMKALLEAGVHFGHQTRRWDPRMKPFIFTQRGGIHIIDLQQTVARLNEAYTFVRNLVAEGGTILFIGTKKQAQETIAEEAIRCGMYYVNQRWMGGMLTNFVTVQSRLRRLAELEGQKANGDFERLPKKEVMKLEEEMARLNRLLGGIKTMSQLPSAVFVIDPHKEALAVAEARKLELPIVALVDTNCNPDAITHPIPANDDAIRAVKLLTGKIADAVIEGAAIRQAKGEETETAAPPAEVPAEVIAEKEAGLGETGETGLEQVAVEAKAEEEETAWTAVNP